MTKDPKVVPAHIRQLLQVRLEDTRHMQVLDKVVRLQRRIRLLCRVRALGEEDGAQDCEKRKVAGGQGWDGHGNFVWTCTWADGTRRRVEFEEDEKEFDDELASAKIAGLLVAIKKCDQRDEGVGVVVAQGLTTALGG